MAMTLDLELETPGGDAPKGDDPPKAARPPRGASVAATALTVITPPTGRVVVDFGELWRFRDLLYFLALRDVKVRYKQTALGVAWAVLQPAMMMAVFTLFFARMAGVPSGGVPYPLFAYAGLLPWTFFATAVAGAGNSVIGSERIITKVYFPRLSIPFAAVAASVIDFVIAVGLLGVMMVYYRAPVGPLVWAAPLIFAVIVFTATGVGTLLSALNVEYRDFRYVIPFLLQIWMFATPTVYMQIDPAPRAGIPAVASNRTTPRTDATQGQGGGPGGDLRQNGAVRLALAINPMTGLIGAFRAAVLGGPMPWGGLAGSAAASVGLFAAGCLYFRKVEDRFADII